MKVLWLVGIRSRVWRRAHVKKKLGKKSPKASLPSFLMYAVLLRFACPDQEEAIGNRMLQRTCLCEPYILEQSSKKGRRRSYPALTEQQNLLLGGGDCHWNGTEVLVFRDMESTCYRASCLPALETGHLFPDHSPYSTLRSSDGLWLWFCECSVKTVSVCCRMGQGGGGEKRKLSILLVEMCTAAFWKCLYFQCTTCEYCLI